MLGQRRSMWPLFAVFLAVFGCSKSQPTTPGSSPNQTTGKPSLVGTWAVTGFQMDGQANPDAQKMPPVRITETIIDLGEGPEAQYKLDVGQPGTIELQRENLETIADDPELSTHFSGPPKVTKGTYKLDGDNLNLTLKIEQKVTKLGAKLTEEIKFVEVVAKLKKTSSTAEKPAATAETTRLQPIKQWQGPVVGDKFRKALPRVMRKGFERDAAGIVLTSQADLDKLWLETEIKDPVPPIDFEKQCAFILLKFHNATALDSVEVDKDKRITHIHFKAEEGRKDDVRYVIAAFPKDSIRAVGSQDPKK